MIIGEKYRIYLPGIAPVSEGYKINSSSISNSSSTYNSEFNFEEFIFTPVNEVSVKFTISMPSILSPQILFDNSISSKEREYDVELINNLISIFVLLI